MTLVAKIPPLVSALAFGYGVGMAVPDGAIASMQTAVHGPTARDQGRAAPSVILAPPPRTAAADMGGPESEMLARLRDEVARERGDGAACELSRPLHSRAPRYETRREGDLPYPPEHPKMPGEPLRVQPSRARRTSL